MTSPALPTDPSFPRSVRASACRFPVNAVLADPKLKARLADLGGTTIPGPSAAFRERIADETEKWAKLIRAAGIQAQ